MVKLDTLKENDKNVRKISDEHFEMLRKSVSKRAWMFEARQIVVRRCDNVVIGGNMRLRALRANGTTEVPDTWIRWIDWTPQQCIDYLIRNSSEAGETVLDLFGGSGTTMIACEQTGRHCRMLEIDPRYCDVIRRRWAEFRHGEGCDWEALTPAT